VPTVIFFLVSLTGILSRRLRFFLGCLVGVFCKKNVDPELKGDGILALVAVAAEEGGEFNTRTFCERQESLNWRHHI
jgi:hypothetical protein